jgi:hypothetical protein
MQIMILFIINVNNQYQNEAFSLYEKEFPELVNKSIGLLNKKKKDSSIYSRLCIHPGQALESIFNILWNR